MAAACCEVETYRVAVRVVLFDCAIGSFLFPLLLMLLVFGMAVAGLPFFAHADGLSISLQDHNS